MNNRLTFTLLFFFASGLLFGQDTTCNCIENLLKTIQKTEENYAGYPTKVNETSNNAYDRLVNNLKTKAITETNSKKCYYIIKQYINFFKDKHFILSYYNEKDFDSSVIQYSEASLQKHIMNKNLSPIEGILINPDSSTHNKSICKSRL